MRSCITYLLVITFVFYCRAVSAQTDSISVKSLPLSKDSLNVDSTLYYKFKDEGIGHALQNPFWYVISTIAPMFNTGMGYSYIMPTNSFANKVNPASSFSFDISVNLTRIFSDPDAKWQLYTGLNMDFTNFGESSPFKKRSGDTTFTLSIKNTMEVVSPYLEVEYDGENISPFFTVGYSRIFLNPVLYKATQVRNSTTNTSVYDGETLSDLAANGFRIGSGLKFKYHFKNHPYRALILCLRGEFVTATETQMVKIETVSFNHKGEATFEYISIAPSWLQLSLMLKYNF